VTLKRDPQAFLLNLDLSKLFVLHKILMGLVNFCLFLLQVSIIASDSVSNSEVFYQETSCDILTDLCETFISANLTLNSSNMTLNLGDSGQSIFFDNIALKYSLTSSSPYTLYDGDFTQEDAQCLCKSTIRAEDACKITPGFSQTPDGFKGLFTGTPNTSICTTPDNSFCCRRVYLKDIRKFRVYSNLTSRFESLQFLYKKKGYSASFSSNTLQLMDMNFIWTGGEQWTLPTDNLAILVNQDSREIISALASTLNGPQEYNLKKSGWWHGSLQVMKWMGDQSVTFTPYSYNLSIPRIAQTVIPDITQVECAELTSANLMNPNFYTSLVKRAVILGTNSTELEYLPDILEARNINVSSATGTLLTICISYPYICMCSNSRNECLEFEGFIKIIDKDSNISKIAYLRGQLLYQTPICTSSEFWSYRNPHNIQVKIESKDIIPKYRMSDCTLKWEIVTATNVSFVSDCILLPCKLIDDTGIVQEVNLTKSQNYIIWSREFAWINLTCGQRTERKTISSTQLADGTLDPIQYLIWGLLTVEFGGSAAFISWTVVIALLAISLNKMGIKQTLISSTVLLIFLWVSGFAFIILTFGLLFLYNYKHNPSRFLRPGRYPFLTPKHALVNTHTQYHEMQ
jgi:hypothetical protein